MVKKMGTLVALWWMGIGISACTDPSPPPAAPVRIAQEPVSQESVAVAEASPDDGMQWQDQLCTVELEFDYPSDLAPTVEKRCHMPGTSAEICQDFFIALADGSGRQPATALRIPMQDDGAGLRTFTFHPVAWENLQVRRRGVIEQEWVLHLLESWGSPTRAEERFMVFDARLKPKTELIDAPALTMYLRASGDPGPLRDRLAMRCRP